MIDRSDRPFPQKGNEIVRKWIAAGVSMGIAASLLSTTEAGAIVDPSCYPKTGQDITSWSTGDVAGGTVSVPKKEVLGYTVVGRPPCYDLVGFKIGTPGVKYTVSTARGTADWDALHQAGMTGYYALIVRIETGPDGPELHRKFDDTTLDYAQVRDVRFIPSMSGDTETVVAIGTLTDDPPRMTTQPDGMLMVWIGLP